MDTYQILVRPVVTEKSTGLNEQGQYVFEVAPTANKIEIKRAVEEAFKVNVTAVNTFWVQPKERRFGRRRGYTRRWKKAIVALGPGQRIELFQGV